MTNLWLSWQFSSITQQISCLLTATFLYQVWYSKLEKLIKDITQRYVHVMEHDLVRDWDKVPLQLLSFSAPINGQG